MEFLTGDEYGNTWYMEQMVRENMVRGLRLPDGRLL